MSDFNQLRVELTNGLGLHLRAASRLVRLVQQFQSEVRVCCGGRAANAKSILDLIMLSAARGTRLEIDVRGPDAEKATEALRALIEEGFHEEKRGRDGYPGP